jgi:hypothetical protein
MDEVQVAKIFGDQALGTGGIGGSQEKKAKSDLFPFSLRCRVANVLV